jgi:hypothetical protein
MSSNPETAILENTDFGCFAPLFKSLWLGQIDVRVYFGKKYFKHVKMCPL